MKDGCLAAILVLIGLVFIGVWNAPKEGVPANQTSPTIDANATAIIDKYARSWGVSQFTDEMTGKTYQSARIKSVNTISQQPPYGETGLAIEYTRHPRYGRQLAFVIDEGQLICGGLDCEGQISFDGKVERLRLMRSQDYSSTVLFAANPDAILAKMNRAKKTVVSLTVYREGAPSFTFEPPEPLDLKR